MQVLKKKTCDIDTECGEQGKVTVSLILEDSELSLRCRANIPFDEFTMGRTVEEHHISSREPRAEFDIAHCQRRIDEHIEQWGLADMNVNINLAEIMIDRARSLKFLF